MVERYKVVPFISRMPLVGDVDATFWCGGTWTTQKFKGYVDLVDFIQN